MTSLVRHYRDVTPDLRGTGVVVEAAHRCQLACSIWRERDLYADAAKALKLPDQALRERVTALGRGVAGGWRAEQKTRRGVPG